MVERKAKVKNDIILGKKIKDKQRKRKHEYKSGF